MLPLDTPSRANRSAEGDARGISKVGSGGAATAQAIPARPFPTPVRDPLPNRLRHRATPFETPLRLHSAPRPRSNTLSAHPSRTLIRKVRVYAAAARHAHLLAT